MKGSITALHARPSASDGVQRTNTIAGAAAIDVTDRGAADRAHRTLTQSPELDAFCNEAFDSIDPDRVRYALATLILCNRADTEHQSTDAIPGARALGLQVLAEHLSPTGLAALQRMLYGDAGHEEFGAYLAAGDWLCLTGLALQKQGEANMKANRLAQAAEDYMTAAEAFGLVAGQAMAAAHAYFAAADALRRNSQPGPAAEIYEMSGGIYARLGKFDLAARAFSTAALAHQGGRRSRLAAAACNMSAEFYMMHAEALQSQGEITQARDAYKLALQGSRTAASYLWDEAQCERQALDAEMRAANILSLLQLHDAAIERFERIAECCGWLHLYTLLEKAHGGTAQAFCRAADDVAADRPEQAARLYLRAAEYYRRAHQHALAGPPSEKAAEIYLKVATTLLSRLPARPTAAQVGEVRVRVGEAYRRAADIYTEAGLHTKAADVHLCIAQLHTLAESPVETAHALRMSAAARLRSAEAYRGVGLHQQAENAYEIAARAFETAALAYRALPHASENVDWLEEAAKAWWTAARAWSEAGQHALAAGACRKAEDVFTTAGRSGDAERAARRAKLHEERTTAPRLSRAGLITALTEEIAKRLAGLKSGLLIASSEVTRRIVPEGNLTLDMVDGQDFVSADVFVPEDAVEWLAVAIGEKNDKYQLVTAMTVEATIRNRHLVSRRPLKESELLGGYDLLELLREAPLDQPGTLAARIDDPPGKSVDTTGKPMSRGGTPQNPLPAAT